MLILRRESLMELMLGASHVATRRRQRPLAIDRKRGAPRIVDGRACYAPRLSEYECRLIEATRLDQCLAGQGSGPCGAECVSA